MSILKNGRPPKPTPAERISQLELEMSILMDIVAQATDIAICDQCGQKHTGPISRKWFHAPPINGEDLVCGGDNGAYLCGMAYCTQCAIHAYYEDDQHFDNEDDQKRFLGDLAYWLAHNTTARKAFATHIKNDDELRAIMQTWVT